MQHFQGLKSRGCYPIRVRVRVRVTTAIRCVCNLVRVTYQSGFGLVESCSQPDIQCPCCQTRSRQSPTRHRVGAGFHQCSGSRWHLQLRLDVLSKPGDMRGRCVYGSVAERGARGVAFGLWLEGRVCSMLTAMQWRLGRRDSGLNLNPKTQTHWYAHSAVRP